MPSSPSSTPAPGAWCRASGTRRTPSMRSTSSSSITCGSPDLRFAAGHLHHAQFVGVQLQGGERSEEHTSELQSLMRISYAVFCLKNKKEITTNNESIKAAENHEKTKHTHRDK